MLDTPKNTIPKNSRPIPLAYRRIVWMWEVTVGADCNWSKFWCLKRNEDAKKKRFIGSSDFIWAIGLRFGRKIFIRGCTSRFGSAWRPISRHILVHPTATQISVLKPFLLHWAALNVTGFVTYLSLQHLPGRLTDVVIMILTARIHWEGVLKAKLIAS